MAQSSAQKIGVSTATIIGMNAMIGSGIFIVPATLASFVGPAGILAFIFVIISVLCMALSLAKVASLFPQEGSFYTYTKQWGGHCMGIIASSAYFIGLLIAMGLLSHVVGMYLQAFVPTLSTQTLGLITLIILTILNMFGVVLSELGQQILICTTVFPLLATTIMCLTKVDFNNLIPFAPHGFTNILKATRKIIFGFFGFECAASLFTIVENPAKNVPRALISSILLVGTIYTLFVGAIMLCVPTQFFTDPNIPLPEILHEIFPNSGWLITIIHISIISAIVGTIHSMIWSSSSLFISLVKELKSQRVQRIVNSGAINQQTSVLLVGLCIFATFTSLSNLDLFFNLSALFIVFAYITSILTLLTIPKERTGFQGIITILGIATALIILYFAFEGLVESFSF